MATLEVTPAPVAVAAGKLEIVANRKELLAELEAVIGVVERRTTIPILANVLLVAEPDGTVYLTATNLDQSIKTSFHAEVHEGGSVAIPARKLYEYVKLLAKDQVIIRQQENHWIHIKCGKSKTKMVGLAAANFPAIPDAPSGEFDVSAPLLREFISKALIAVSTEESRYTLNAALLAFSAGVVSMVSLDGHRLIQIQKTVDETDYKRAMLIPHSALLELLSLLKAYGGDVIRYSEDDKSLYFGVGVRRLTSRKLAGSFPAYQNAMPKVSGHGLMLDVQTVAESLNRILLFSEHDTRSIRLALEETTLGIYSAAKDLGESRDEIDILGGPSELLDIGFNGDYLKEFLGAIGGTVECHFTDNKSAAQFTWRTDDGITLRYVLMPMRAK